MLVSERLRLSRFRHGFAAVAEPLRNHGFRDGFTMVSPRAQLSDRSMDQRAKRMANDDNDLVDAFLADRAMRELEDYTKRGRLFEHLANDDLERRWATAFRDWASLRLQRQPSDTTDMDDLQAEIALRGRQVPLDLVKSEFDALRALQDESMQRQGALARMERDFSAELEEFKRRNQQAPKN
jgi:hypothetical protein